MNEFKKMHSKWVLSVRMLGDPTLSLKGETKENLQRREEMGEEIDLGYGVELKYLNNKNQEVTKRAIFKHFRNEKPKNIYIPAFINETIDIMLERLKNTIIFISVGKDILNPIAELVIVMSEIEEEKGNRKSLTKRFQFTACNENGRLRRFLFFLPPDSFADISQATFFGSNRITAEHELIRNFS